MDKLKSALTEQDNSTVLTLSKQKQQVSLHRLSQRAYGQGSHCNPRTHFFTRTFILDIYTSTARYASRRAHPSRPYGIVLPLANDAPAFYNRTKRRAYSGVAGEIEGFRWNIFPKETQRCGGRV